MKCLLLLETNEEEKLLPYIVQVLKCYKAEASSIIYFLEYVTFSIVRENNNNVPTEC